LAVSVATVFATPLSTSPNFNVEPSALALAPLVAEDHPYGTINNSYIVLFKDDLPIADKDTHMNFLLAAHGDDPLLGEDFAGVTHVYDGHITGYAGYFTENVIDQIRRLPEVKFVEKDQIVRTQETQRSAPWGLARISHRPKLTFGTFTKYEYDPDAGEGVDVYVIDTGINVDHDEFEGRAFWGKTVPTDDIDIDGNGHGTHCAGTIASRKYGVAKKAHVVAVKVLGTNGSGTMSDVLEGVVWATNAAKHKAAAAAAEYAATGRTKHKGSVANMSLGGGKSPSLDQAVDKASVAGLHFAVAAGNDNRDACSYSPAGSLESVTVGASTLGDERAYFSNYGTCVDVFAPGMNILSTFKGGKTAIATMSGTSMASPHVAGLLAYLLSIYPSKQFDPVFDEYNRLLSVESQRGLSSLSDESTSPASLYALAHRALPSFISSYLPRPEFIESVLQHTDVAPIPEKPKTLTPRQLKQALLALATKDILAELPQNTVNLLVYNNATIY